MCSVCLACLVVGVVGRWSVPRLVPGLSLAGCWFCCGVLFLVSCRGRGSAVARRAQLPLLNIWWTRWGLVFLLDARDPLAQGEGVRQGCPSRKWSTSRSSARLSEQEIEYGKEFGKVVRAGDRVRQGVRQG